MKRVSVIIPVRQGETETASLLKELSPRLPSDWEIIVSQSDRGRNRAQTLNKGAEQSQGEFLWFLHGDSRISSETIPSLKKAISEKPNVLHYFKLRFYPAHRLMKINACGANLRSQILRSPFGDQGLCIQKGTFLSLGGFDESTSYGEDLLFVWKAQQNGIRLNRIPSYLYTSDRKYRKQGWIKITILHQYLYWKLAIRHFGL
ncbi:glycosyltransferase [Leptospira yasudae]|uniref:Glycosyltransferase 2-like domain-containing protein n=1 Tax=Leptospira yasudae TaxID=2202201 RepID=A0ABX9M8W8_9LEPT|nr:glycosyltransferase [Leptospira yasudae]RHX81617.1 hypothetical protein DLM77_05950 [Leptospira yasudae]